MAAQQKLSYIPQVEWEGLQEPYAIASVDETLAAPGAECVDVWRDEAYRIRGKLAGTGHEAFDIRPNMAIGDFLTGVKLTGFTENAEVRRRDDGELEVVRRKHVYDLPDCHILNRSTHWAKDEPETFACDLSPRCVRRAVRPPVDPTRLTDWYLNGPHADEMYPGVIGRELGEEYRKTVFGARAVYPALSMQQEENAGYALVEYEGGRFLVYATPRGCGPSWSHNIGIEFRDEWGSIPDEERRIAIGEIVAFVVGRRLIHVGSTAFDGSGWPVAEVSYDPWGNNVAAVCAMPDHAPIKFGRQTPHDRLETSLAQLVTPYIDMREELGLKDVLWLYWLSREATPGIDLLIAAAALERLMDRWLRSRRSKTGNVYLSGREFKAITRDEFAAITAKLEGVAGQEYIMRTLENAFEIRGVRAKRDAFFSELGLPIGPIEDQALKARNPVAHGYGGPANSAANSEQTIRNGDAYLTLLDRVLLKLLGYAGSYVDRSAPHFPETPLDRPMAGWPT